MCTRIATALISLVLLWPAVKLIKAQDSSSIPRKLVTKVNPVYPDLARRLQLSGTVKMGVVIAPNGTVKKTRVLGGSPLLAAAAQEAVQKWKWISASDETEEVIEIGFHPTDHGMPAHQGQVVFFPSHSGLSLVSPLSHCKVTTTFVTSSIRINP